jgi:hypothetical protein
MFNLLHGPNCRFAVLVLHVFSFANPNAMFSCAGAAKRKCMLHELISELFHERALIWTVIEE